MSPFRRYPSLEIAREVALGLVEKTGRHHVIWLSGRSWRVVPLHGAADRWLRATTGRRQLRVLATPEQRLRRARRPLFGSLFPRRRRVRFGGAERMV